MPDTMIATPDAVAAQWDYDYLPYHRVSLKASHNSEERSEPIGEQLDFDPNTPYQAGCRSVEFDTFRHSDGSGGTSRDYFQVTHRIGGNGPPLAQYLEEVLAWDLRNPSHGVVSVFLDIKSTVGDYTVFSQ